MSEKIQYKNVKNTFNCQSDICECKRCYRSNIVLLLIHVIINSQDKLFINCEFMSIIFMKKYDTYRWV